MTHGGGNEGTMDIDPTSQMEQMAARNDPWARQLASRTAAVWFKPLWEAGCHLPFYLVADLGVLLVRDVAQLAAGGAATPEYVTLLREMRADETFRQCAGIVMEAEPKRQDETIRTAVECMTARARGIVKDPNGPDADQRREVDARMAAGFRARDSGGWMMPTDLIRIRSASRLKGGPKLLDYQLLAECLAEWNRAAEHTLRTRRSPTRRVGVKDVSRRAGDIIGYTGVRPRLPTDDLIEILPSEWALMKENPSLGLDKIFNQTNLVHSKESPHDLVPRLHVLVAFIIDVDPAVFFEGKPRSREDLERLEARVMAACRAKALTYRMVLDAAQQVPFEIMTVHTAVYVVCFGNASTLTATCFDLKDYSAGLAPSRAIVRYDELVPYYFYYSHLRTARGHRRTGPWPELSDDPFIFLTSASAAVSTYTSVLTVICSEPGRWPRVFPAGTVPLRPVEVGRPTTLLVQASGTGENRTFDWCSFSNLTEAAIGHVAQFRHGMDLDVRNAFLDMLLGPVRSGLSASVAGRITVG